MSPEWRLRRKGLRYLKKVIVLKKRGESRRLRKASRRLNKAPQNGKGGKLRSWRFHEAVLLKSKKREVEKRLNRVTALDLIVKCELLGLTGKR